MCLVLTWWWKAATLTRRSSGGPIYSWFPSQKWSGWIIHNCFELVGLFSPYIGCTLHQIWSYFNVCQMPDLFYFSVCQIWSISHTCILHVLETQSCMKQHIIVIPRTTTGRLQRWCSLLCLWGGLAHLLLMPARPRSLPPGSLLSSIGNLPLILPAQMERSW